MGHHHPQYLLGCGRDRQAYQRRLFETRRLKTVRLFVARTDATQSRALDRRPFSTAAAPASSSLATEPENRSRTTSSDIFDPVANLCETYIRPTSALCPKSATDDPTVVAQQERTWAGTPPQTTRP